LIVSGIDGMDGGGTALEQAIGKTAGGGTDVEADPTGGIDLKMVEGGFEFEAAASDVAIRGLELKRGVGRELFAGFGEGTIPAANEPGHDGALGFFAGGKEATFDEQKVESLFGDAHGRGSG